MAKAGKQRDWLACTLRTFNVINFLTGIGFIIYGCIIQTPPVSALPLGLVIVGSCAAATALLGCFATVCNKCCLPTYLILGAVITLAQLGITISLFVDLSGSVDNISGYELEQDPTWDGADTLTTQLEVGRWFFLIAVILQSITILIAVVLLLRKPKTGQYEDFEAQQQAEQQADPAAQSQIQLEQLKRSISRSTSKAPAGDATYASSSKLYKSVTKKMTSKYGDFTTEAAFQKPWWKRMF